MSDHFSSRNSEWAPALLLYGWANSLGTSKERHCAQIRDPSKSSRPLKDQAEHFGKFMLLQLLRVLTVAGAPLASFLEVLVYLRSAATAIAFEFKRVVAGFIGYQSQKLPGQVRGSVRALNWDFMPNLRRWHVSLGLILLGGFVYRTVRALAKSCSHASWRLRSLEERLEVAKSFAQWQSLADDLDAIRDEQSRNSSSARQPQLYDESLLRAKVTELQELRATGQVEKLVSALRADLFRDFGNSTNKEIHRSRHILPQPIRDYITTVNSTLEFLAESDAAGPLTHRLKTFQEMRHTFGRTALVLSGGGALGTFHLGIVRGLMEQGLLPRIIAGSSVGAIIAAIAAVHTDDELRTMYSNIDNFNLSFFANNSTLEAVFHLMKKGSLQDIKFLVKRLRKLLADITFLEAHERTNRFLNVTVTAADTNEPPRMLNFMTAPNVLVWSAVACSSAFPGLFPAQELLARDRDGRFVKFASPTTSGMQRRWHDGSLENDLPFRQLSEMFNVNHFIVSQTNPHLVPLMTLKKVVPGPIFNMVKAEVKHAFAQAQLYLPTWVPTKWMRLFTQPWEGDVTIILPWRLYSKSISKVIHNPEQFELVNADREGILAAWAHMSAIQGNTAIELKLDQCLSHLISQARRGKSGNLSAGHLRSLAHHTNARMPSWLHLPSLPAFSERARLLSNDTEDAPTPPLSHYARDDALREVAIHGNSAAAHLLITQRSDSSTPTSTPQAHSPVEPTSPCQPTGSGSPGYVQRRSEDNAIVRASQDHDHGPPDQPGGPIGGVEGDHPAADRTARSSRNGQVRRGGTNGPVGLLRSSGGGTFLSANGVMSRAAFAMALQRRVRSAENMQEFVESGDVSHARTGDSPQGHPANSTPGRGSAGRGGAGLAGA